VPLGEKAEEQKKKDAEEKKKFEEMNKKEAERLEKEMPEEAKLRKAQEKARDEKIVGKQEPQNTQAPFGDHEAGLRTETPRDSKTVKEEASGSTTKKGR
jgi:hypothetical protein